ncbi:2-oxoglutarate and iron-dependent oxygenase JMJD4 homolog [Aedes albopictus]|uniref:Jumonji domain-containing protein 4 n=1 Tax=Aedes albopictus TaxID=7160 RepID=A0ABM1ZGT9_AEDAL|nr:2-oxoglutarate and iron-dependent oxygenase JMJD4 homolog [Aedes albopictus]
MASLTELEIGPTPATFPEVSFPVEITRLPASELSYGEFFSRFMQTNTAVIIGSVADRWKCFRRWVHRDRDDDAVDKVDVTYLKARIGNVTVPVADCGRQYYNAHEKRDMQFHEFLDYWADRKEEHSKMYLKDWHLREIMPQYRFYETPMFFGSDWLNEYLIDRKLDDYMFVYIGPKGTWTSFHADVFASYSWSTNIYGVKRWLLLPPGEEIKLKDKLGNFPFEISEELLKEKQVRYYDIRQTAGEAIFVPSGWYHQVQNLEDAISVNHNWFNGCNIANIWASLWAAYEQVVKEIDDCRDMDNFDEHCQLMLKASYGMNLEAFLDILEHVANKRIGTILGGVDVVHFDIYKLGKCHIQFDLMKIQDVLSSMHEQNMLLETLRLLTKVEENMDKIKSALRQF